MTCSTQPTDQTCCRRAYRPSAFSYLRLAERVSIAALAALACYTNPSLFASFLSIGSAIGTYQRRYGEEESISNRNGISCSQGFLEQLTQERLPPLVSLAVNLAITWCHLQHHANIFVPIIGLSIGNQLGRRVSFATHSTWAV